RQLKSHRSGLNSWQHRTKLLDRLPMSKRRLRRSLKRPHPMKEWKSRCLTQQPFTNLLQRNLAHLKTPHRRPRRYPLPRPVLVKPHDLQNVFVAGTIATARMIFIRWLRALRILLNSMIQMRRTPLQSSHAITRAVIHDWVVSHLM
ncbi:hypothetical protein GN958_ATG00193, partial [Phytophthora infestans]